MNDPNRRAPPPEKRAGSAIRLLGALWVTILFSPHWWLAIHGPDVILKLPVVLFLALGAALAAKAVTSPRFARRWTWYSPLLAFIVVSAASTVFTLNAGRSVDALQFMILFWTLVVGTVALVDSARRAEKLLLLYGTQFLFWGALGAQTGLILWEPVLANYDAYGAWMVVGGGFCSFLIVATSEKWIGRLMALAVALCAVGVVASFARGAFLSAVAVFGIVWYRSPSRAKTLGWGLAAAVVAMGAAALLHDGAYWDEIMSTFEEGTEEGTGEDRWVMWQAGWKVFLDNPLLGAGPENWGVYAAANFQPGEVGGVYAQNPSMLYGRQLHSSYVQVLSEQGILGVVCFVWILVDFWRRNAVLRTRAAAERWRQLGGNMDLRTVALGLEAGLVGWMGAAAFYSLAGTHWLYTIVALNLLLHSLIRKGTPRHSTTGRAHRSRVNQRSIVSGAVPGAS